MTADKHILPKCHKRTFSRVCSAQPNTFFSHFTVYHMSIPSRPLEIRNSPLQEFSLSYRNQSIHKAVSYYRELWWPKQPMSWKSWEALSNLEQQGLGLCFGQAGKNGEGSSWVTGVYHPFFIMVHVSRELKNFSVIKWKSNWLPNAEG